MKKILGVVLLIPALAFSMAMRDDDVHYNGSGFIFIGGSCDNSDDCKALALLTTTTSSLTILIEDMDTGEAIDPYLEVTSELSLPESEAHYTREMAKLNKLSFEEFRNAMLEAYSSN